MKSDAQSLYESGRYRNEERMVQKMINKEDDSFVGSSATKTRTPYDGVKNNNKVLKTELLRRDRQLMKINEGNLHTIGKGKLSNYNSASSQVKPPQIIDSSTSRRYQKPS